MHTPCIYIYACECLCVHVVRSFSRTQAQNVYRIFTILHTSLFTLSMHANWALSFTEQVHCVLLYICYADLNDTKRKKF